MRKEAIVWSMGYKNIAVNLWRAMALLVLACLLAGNEDTARAEMGAFAVDDEIVYFDSNNVIRAFDPSPPNTQLRLEWASPQGGWGDMVVADVTGDGDAEIIAIRSDENGGTLTIFDPVAQDSPDNQVQFINGIPWAILYELKLAQAPRTIATGEFDTTRPGQEILFSFTLNDEFDRFVLLRSTGTGLPGREWEQQKVWELEGRWSASDTGNMYIDDEIDEVALVSFDRGELGIFRIEPEVIQTFSNINLAARWRDVAFGQYVVLNNDGDGDEVAAVRDADDPLASVWIFRYDGTKIVDVLGERHTPSPNVVFFADIRGNGDDEMITLRQVRQELGPRPRLILRDGNPINDTVTMREEVLDGDNEYKGGDGGDVDGDGREEVIVMRNNRIRVYYEPESSTSYQLIELNTNGQTIKTGNLDANGLAARSRLFATQTRVSAEMPPGQAASGVATISLQDVTKGASLPFTARLEGVSGWATVSQTANTLPGDIQVRFQTEGIQPGVYSGQVLVEVEADNVDNNPLRIDLSLTVANVISAEPSKVDFVYFPCSDPLPVQDRVISLSASSSLSYTAQIEGNPSWITVAPEAGVLPEEVRVTVDPSGRSGEVVFTDLLVTVDLPNEAGIVNRIPIIFACPNNRSYLPVVTRQGS